MLLRRGYYNVLQPVHNKTYINRVAENKLQIIVKLENKVNWDIMSRSTVRYVTLTHNRSNQT